jgi:hypothetical protein
VHAIICILLPSTAQTSTKQLAQPIHRFGSATPADLIMASSKAKDPLDALQLLVNDVVRKILSRQAASFSLCRAALRGYQITQE